MKTRNANPKKTPENAPEPATQREPVSSVAPASRMAVATKTSVVSRRRFSFRAKTIRKPIETSPTETTDSPPTSGLAAGRKSARNVPTSGRARRARRRGRQRETQEAEQEEEADGGKDEGEGPHEAARGSRARRGPEPE